VEVNEKLFPISKTGHGDVFGSGWGGGKRTTILTEIVGGDGKEHGRKYCFGISGGDGRLDRREGILIRSAQEEGKKMTNESFFVRGHKYVAWNERFLKEDVPSGHHGQKWLEGEQGVVYMHQKKHNKKRRGDGSLKKYFRQWETTQQNGKKDQESRPATETGGREKPNGGFDVDWASGEEREIKKRKPSPRNQGRK